MSLMPARGNRQPVWLFPLVFSVVLLLSAVPLGRLAVAGFSSLSSSAASQLLSDPVTWSSLRNTLVTSVGGTVLSVALGSTFALCLVLTDVGRRNMLSFLFMLPMMIPPQVTALAWVQMSGPASPLLKTLGLAPPLGSPQPLYSLSGIALLLGVQNAPLVFLALRATIVALPRDLVEAARLSGASPVAVLRDVILPLSLPGIIAGAAITFVSNVGNFGIPAILGIPASILTLPTLIYGKLSAFGPETFGEIAALSAVIAGVSALGLLVQTKALGGREFRLVGLSGRPASFCLGRLRRPVEAGLWTILFFILVAPMLALVASSLVPTYGVPLTMKTVSLAAYSEILFRQSVTSTAFSNSIFLSVTTALGLLVLSLLAASSIAQRPGRLSSLMIMMIDIPYALPGIVLGVAFILLFAAPLPVVHVSLYGTIWVILLAYLSSFFAVSLKPIAAAFLQLEPSLEEAARLSGAGYWRRMRDILLPLVAPAAGASVILVFLIACNELTVSALLWSAGSQTLGVAIYNLDDSGSSDLASALSVLVVAMVVSLMLCLELIGRQLPRGVLPWRN